LKGTVVQEQTITRENPTAFLFLVDQSVSMGYPMAGANKPKAKYVADLLNRTILNLVDLCNKSGGIRDYFHIGVINYGGLGVGNALLPNEPILTPISQIADRFKKVETIIEKGVNLQGDEVERKTQYPVWLEAEANGETPMCEAFSLAAAAVMDWCAKHPASYPPIVINITDGDSTDGNPEDLALGIKDTGTMRGSVLLFNIHVSSIDAEVIKYPPSSQRITDEYAAMLFRMSSTFPQYLVDTAKRYGYRINTDSKGFVFNADAADIVNFLEIGTLPAQNRRA
jgi:hypothetical protein